MNRPLRSPHDSPHGSDPGGRDREARELARLDQLLADRAIGDLSSEEWSELEALLAADPDADPDAFDRAAAWLEVAHQESHPEAVEPLPAHLRDRIVADGKLRVRSHRLGVHRSPAGVGKVVELPKRDATPAVAPSAPVAARPPTGATPPAPAPGLGVLGYAAALLLGLTLGLLIVGGGDRPLTPEQAYAELLRRHTSDEIARAPWAGIEGEMLAGMSGEVIWCDVDQEGYMLLEGLPVNDASREQYQLWIVDEDRGHAQPVDGGVFDVTSADGVQTIPIDAALAVDAPGLFVITLEPKGGVPVSDGPFLATAAVGGG